MNRPAKAIARSSVAASTQPNARRRTLLSAMALTAAAGTFGVVRSARAADKLKIGVFPSASSLPIYVGIERGYFKEVDIEIEAVPMNTHPLQIQALVAGDIDGSSNLVTLEGANINGRRPNTVVYISLNGQNAQYVTEQFVVKPGSTAKTLKDLKGARIFCAPGPANLGAAKAILKTVGLEEGKDYTMSEQGMGVHIGAITGASFDAGYTLEPLGTMMIKQGVAKRLEGGVIATHLLGRVEAQAYAAGGLLAGKLITEKPEVAARYARAFAKSVKDAGSDPKAREYLTKFNVPADIIASVPLAKFTMVKDLAPADIADFQKFVSLGVDMGVVKEKIDVKTMLKAY
jgi:NitT/TauT family transport system substrate-binding protein